MQGVGFRYFTKINAQRIGVRGWVKNLPDGRVETVLEGEEMDVEKLISLIRQGPSSGVVTNMTVEWIAPKNEFGDFNIRY